MKSVRALLFDLDETLLDGSGNREAIVRTCARIAASQPALDATQLLDANTEVWRRYWPEVADLWTLGALEGAAVSLEAWRRTLRACGCDDESLARLARTTHEEIGRETLCLFDDVMDALASLRAGVAFGLITNGAADTQRDKLRILGIEHYFGAIVISGEVGIAKPDAAVFQIALDKLRVEPGDAWHVGDSPGTDIAGAKAADMTAVWLNRSGSALKDGEVKADYEIRSLADLPLLLATVSSAAG